VSRAAKEDLKVIQAQQASQGLCRHHEVFFKQVYPEDNPSQEAFFVSQEEYGASQNKAANP